MTNNKPDKHYLIQFLTDPEKDLLSRMYPNGLPNNERVFSQIETTLLNREKKRIANEEMISKMKSDHETEILKLKSDIEKLNNEIEQLRIKKIELNKTSNDYETKKSLAKLYALEAGGVDNWEGCGESLEEWSKEYEK